MPLYARIVAFLQLQITALPIVATLLLLLPSAFAGGQSVPLQNATATYSQEPWLYYGVATAINGIDQGFNDGWAIHPTLGNQTAVFETVSNSATAGRTTLTFRLVFANPSVPGTTGHTLGRFRLSATTDARDTFADGFESLGDVTANWTVLEPLSLSTTSGATLRTLEDLSILASGTLVYADTYTITVLSPLTGITGFRLEAIEDPSLPHMGPGREPWNGNFHLSEFQVSADTAIALPPPTVTTQPLSQIIDIGGNASFSLAAQGDGILHYQWYFNGVPLAGETNASLSLTNVQASDAGTYFARASDANGFVLSDGAVLDVGANSTGARVRFANRVEPALDAAVTDAYGAKLSGPVYLAQLFGGPSPLDLSPIGPAIPFGSGAAAGYFDGGVRSLPGSNTYLSVRAWDSTAGPTYSNAVASGASYGSSATMQVVPGDDTAPPAVLSGLQPFALLGAPRIARQPANVSTTNHAEIRLSVEALGTAPIQFQWLKNGVPLSEQTGSVITFGNASSVDSGDYAVVVSNAIGSVISAPAQLIVTDFDFQSPVIVLDSPAPGITTLEQITLAGEASDDVRITRLEWRLNGSYPEAFGSNRFSIPLKLVPGDNRIEVRAFDAAGNAGVAGVTVTYLTPRAIYVSPVSPVTEGGTLVVPVMMRIAGEVGAASIVLSYPSTYLADPRLDWAHIPDGSLSSINTNTLGEIRASLALSGISFPEGTNLLATVTFRVRSIPQSLFTSIDLRVQGLYDLDGRPTGGANTDASSALELLKRRFTGDNNANGQLDVGDASILMRLVTLLDPPRTWDVPANDLNANHELDAGDVIRVLRTVVGLDPQPAAATATAALARAQSLAPQSQVPRISLSTDRLRLRAGERVKVRMHVSNWGTALSGASFALDFPAESLALENASSIRLGSILPANALNQWNLEPARNDFAIQTGEFQFGVSSSSPWAQNNGEIMELTFLVRPGAEYRSRIPIVLSNARLTDGWEMASVAGTQLELAGAEPITPSISGSRLLDGGAVELRIFGEPGHRFSIERTSDLKNWTETAIVTAELGGMVHTESTQNDSHQFFRLKPIE